MDKSARKNEDRKINNPSAISMTAFFYFPILYDFFSKLEIVDHFFTILKFWQIVRKVDEKKVFFTRGCISIISGLNCERNNLN